MKRIEAACAQQTAENHPDLPQAAIHENDRGGRTLLATSVNVSVIAPQEALKRLCELFDEPARQVGLKRVAKSKAWSANAGDMNVFFSLQTDTKATDPYAGGGFRLELEKSRNAKPDMGLKGRALFFQLLTTSELESVLRRQNEIIAGLPAPPDSQIALYPAGRVRDMYLSYFGVQAAFDAIHSWLRFRSTEDLAGWRDVLAPMLDDLLARAARYLNPDEMHLGKGSLL